MEDIRVPDVWLQGIGFKLGNPFSTREASREPEPALLQYFINHPGFDDVMGDALHPMSAFLVAERGCGKTTTRRAIEWNCLAGRPNGLILPIPYLEFSAPLEYADESGKVPIDYHLKMIIKEAVPLLLERLAQNSNFIDAFSLGFRKMLAEYLAQYTDLNTDVGLDKWLRKIGYQHKKINSEILSSGKNFKGDVFLRFLIELLEIAPEQQNKKKLSATEQMAEFVLLIELAGYKAVYILIDRLDEREPMSSDPRYAANLLASLVTNLPILELDKVAFKFFLTPAIMNVILEHGAFRADRLMIRHINWGADDLQRLLDRRVEVFTKGALPSLDVVCEPDLAGSLVSRLASLADGSPRNMMRLAEWLLFWHHARNTSKNRLLISKDDLARAAKSFENEIRTTPRISNETLLPVRVDESNYVWRGSIKLKRLPVLQGKLLRYLIEQKGKVCSYSSLRGVVYNEINTERIMGDNRIDQLVKRIRQVVEVDPSHPKYIIKAPEEKGYVFE